MFTHFNKTIGRYHLIEPLGEGGMAVVYKAYDTHLECEVAVKVIRTENLPQSGVERALKRFEREAKAVARLTHPNIVKVTDYGEDDGKPYLVMPFLPGGTLKQLIKERGQIPWQEAARILIPIAEALAYAHSQGVIHRDIKPSNILLTSTGQPMLTDFGVAKIIEDEATQDLTGTSATVGTPEYMAPEQITSKTVDARADLYSLGVVFYEMVTGRKPFEADTPMAVMVMHSRDPLPRPSQFVRNLPSAVEQFLIKALAKNPNDRFQSAEEILRAQQDFSLKTDKGKSRDTSQSTTQQKFSKKAISRFVLIVLSVILLIGFVYLLSTLVNKEKPAQIIQTSTNTIMPSRTFTLEPTKTLEPSLTVTVTITPTPENVIEVMVDTSLKCRQGPSEYLYPYSGVINPQTIKVLGTNKDGSWIYFQAEQQEETCWTKKNLVDFPNNITELPIVDDPENHDPIYYGYILAICKYRKGDMYAGFFTAGWNGTKCWAEPLCYLYFTDNDGYYFNSLTDAYTYETPSDYIKIAGVIPFTIESQINNQLGINSFNTVIQIPCSMNYDGTFYELLH